jgi:CheY-like chemotaxis protein
MMEEAKRRAFEPFFTTKPAGKGSGLGLSMVYGFARQSEGHVLIRSALGEGTTVRLYFPRAVSGRTELAAPERGAVVPSVPNTGTVLIVEDDPLVREHAAHSFHALGYTVSLAASAEQALSTLETESGIFMLFTDIVLGAGMNGLELAAEARRRRPDLKVLYTSGYVPGDVGFNNPLVPDADLLRKPYAQQELVQKLAELLRPVPAGD